LLQDKSLNKKNELTYCNHAVAARKNYSNTTEWPEAFQYVITITTIHRVFTLTWIIKLSNINRGLKPMKHRHKHGHWQVNTDNNL
jgi:hypothetical protein